MSMESALDEKSSPTAADCEIGEDHQQQNKAASDVLQTGLKR